LSTNGRTSIRSGLALALFTATASTASAQDVEIAPRLRAGDTFRIEIVRVRENSQQPQLNGRSTTPVDVLVDSVTTTGKTLEWTQGPTTFENPQVAANQLVAAASNAVRGIKLRITLSADGEYSGLANEAEVTTALRKRTDTIVQAILPKLPLEQRATFEKMIAQLLSPALLIASATREPQMYFGLNAVSLAVGEVVDAKIDQPNPLGAGVIPTVFRVTMESATSASADLRTTTTYDAAALRQMTGAMIAQSGDGLSEKDLAELPPIELADDGRYVFDRVSGLMREIVVNRRVSAGAVRRLDGWVIRLGEAPKR
jgi:hypothetical protein